MTRAFCNKKKAPAREAAKAFFVSRAMTSEPNAKKNMAGRNDPPEFSRETID